MGKEVEEFSKSTGSHIIYRLDSVDDWKAAGIGLKNADVVIDFSWPASAVDNIRRSFDLKLPVVIGTTGWYDKMEQVKEWCRTEDQAIFVAPNFSIGVNMMLQLTEKLSRMLNRFRNYDVSIEEIHHIHKLDAPSGTALMLARALMENLETKKKWSADLTDDPSILYIASRREGEVTGTHIVRAESSFDSLEITHQARNRKGFAAGALLAAEWLLGRHGFFTMKDLMEWSD